MKLFKNGKDNQEVLVTEDVELTEEEIEEKENELKKAKKKKTAIGIGVGAALVGLAAVILKKKSDPSFDEIGDFSGLTSDEDGESESETESTSESNEE